MVGIDGLLFYVPVPLLFKLCLALNSADPNVILVLR